MKIAYVIYDDITWLDFIGVYDPVSRLSSLGYLPDLSWEVCGLKQSARDSNGLEMNVGKVGETLSGYDAIIVPGGLGTRNLIESDPGFIEWLKTAARVPYKISVCTGSLLLGAAGFLTDKKATTHFNEYETLKKYCRMVLPDRIVEDGKTITAGAVSSSIDLGLFLCRKWSGPDAEKEIRRRLDYRG